MPHNINLHAVTGPGGGAGAYGEQGFQPFDMDRPIKKDADYVLFNGSVGALNGEKSLTANVGETERLYVGNGGPTLVPAGGAAVAECRLDVPGNFIMVDHSIFRAFNKGALAMISVDGKEDKMVYSGKYARH